jgi:formylglycine-generating enzyme required for sulfatase activity
MEAALTQFAKAATGADQAVVYYSGHGIEVGEVNYLLPVEASIESEPTVPVEAVSLAAVMGIASGGRQLGLVVLDACRDNPLAGSMKRADGATRGAASRGLVRVEASGNLLVAYATRDGQVASDGAGTHSPYTTAILDALKEPGLEVRLFWGKVHDSVLSATNRSQEPFTYGALGAKALYLNPPASAASVNPAGPPPPAYDSRAAELALWQSAQSLGTAEAYLDYLKKYPEGQFSDQAKLHVAALTRPVAGGQSSVSSMASVSSGSAVPTVSGHHVRETFRDCADVCPEMVVIPPGHFQMGSPRLSMEEPVHEVRIGYVFAVGKYPVTRGEFRQYLAATGRAASDTCMGNSISKSNYNGTRSWLNPGFPQDDNHPVVCVTWEQAQGYANWLSQKVGHPYRLLSEAEYEYAARAGTTTAYYWGDDIGRGHANCDGCGSNWDNKQTSPVGSFAPNPWGLFDMLGDVVSWSQDCWHDNYSGAPSDGSAWRTGGCSLHVLRGGTWGMISAGLHASARYTGDGTRAFNSEGFRLARD